MMMAAGDDPHGAVPVRVRVRGQACLRVHPSSSSSTTSAAAASPSSFSESARPIFLVFCKTRCVVTTYSKDSYSSTPVAQLGVVVCGPQGRLVLRGHKPLSGLVVAGHDGDDGDQEWLDAMALLEGLYTAIRLGITRVKAITDHRLLHNHMLGLSRPAGHTALAVAAVISQALSLQKYFEQCEISLLTDGYVGQVVKPAKERLDDEITRYLATKENTESCTICFEDVDTAEFHAVEGCGHRFCLVCMKEHMEVSLLGGMAPRCPEPGCTTKLTLGSSKAVLSPRFLEIMAQRLKAGDINIHPSQRIYCPYPKCSALMSLSQLQVQGSLCSEYPATFRECVECGRPMCVDCKVAWHEKMSCLEYKRRYPHGGDPHGKRLQKLARRNMWKQCERCNHMIELAVGCARIFCVCGNHLCYRCGKTLAEEDRSCACTGLARRRQRRRCFSLPTCWGGLCRH